MADFPLLNLPGVILTPHLVARTYTAIENMSWVVRDVVDVIEASGRSTRRPVSDSLAASSPTTAAVDKVLANA